MPKFKFDPNSTKRQGRLRLKDPGHFKRFYTIPGKIKGITYIKGVTESGETKTQAIRFDKKHWTEARAANWWKKNNSRFHKTWKAGKWQDLKESFLIYEARDFDDTKHNWSEVLIDKDKQKLTRGEIRDYYMQNVDKIFPSLHNKSVLILIGVGKNKTILKRNLDNDTIKITKKHGIDDPESFEYWVNRRVIEFHPVLGDTTDFIFVDVDIHSDNPKKAKKLYDDAYHAAQKIVKGLRSKDIKTSIWKSGKTGIHIHGELKKPVNVDEARNTLKSFLDKMFKNDDIFTTGIAKPGQIRLDVTTLKNTGSLRAPYTISILGHVKVPMENKNLNVESRHNNRMQILVNKQIELMNKQLGNDDGRY